MDFARGWPQSGTGTTAHDQWNNAFAHRELALKAYDSRDTILQTAQYRPQSL
jgi:hypothetical protein